MREKSLFRRRGFFLVVPLLGLLVVGAGACRRGSPDVSSEDYRKTVSTFYVGLAALQVGDDVRAETKLKEATALAPDEPAAWANLGLLYLRQKEFERAAENLEKARTLAPDNAQIHVLLGLLESNRGRFAEAITHLRRAVELDPKNLKAVYMLAQEIEREGGQDSDAEAQRLFENILETQADNLAVQLELTRIAAKRGDAETLRRTVALIAERASSWPPEVQEQLRALQQAAAGENPRQAATRVAFLRNVLLRVSEYRQSLLAVRYPPEIAGEPFTRFVKLPSPNPQPAPPDEALSFAVEPLTGVASADKPSWVGAVSLNGEGAPVVLTANAREVRVEGGATLAFPGGASAALPGTDAVAALDFDYDFKTDLVLAGAGGVRLFKQDSPTAFSDVTARTSLPSAVTNAAYVGAWAADVELDGDLDILLAPERDAPLVLRNNGDGTFKELRTFASVNGVRGFAWADLDGDGDPDAAFINGAGQLAVFSNERGGQFRARALPSEIGNVVAVSVADVNADGRLDLVTLQADGEIRRLSDKAEGEAWETASLGRSPVAVGSGAIGNLPDAASKIFVADFDNNGSLDLLVSGASDAAVLLSDAQGNFKPLAAQPRARVFAVADVTNDGRLDLLGLSADGQTLRGVNRGAKNYHWQTVRTRAQQTTGDQRINSFGIGGEMEIRSGLLVQKQPITSPLVHFGLGENTSADMVRIVWPNGSPRAEFELKADQSILAEQRLKGSCPSLFAFDGKEMRFVKDCAPWSPAIGLRINSYQTAEVTQTEEWVKIRGDQLAPRDGFYDLRITAELWETYYLDHYSLLVVDHPAGTDIFVDERTARVPPELKVYTVASPRPFAGAWDERGQDVTAVVRARDGQYLDTFGRGAYQGITRDHYVELELDEAAPRTGPLWLVAHGWLHPTDASINVAMSQGRNEPPQGLRLEVPDGAGGWVVARPGLGFPAGKNKTIMVDLDGVFLPGTPRRVRLRTNMEIYWDTLEWAAGRPDAQTRTERLAPATAELRYRGFSVMNQANQSSPETPEYRLASTTQHWRDLVGYYTRFGDVRELLAKVDDRFVIANAGDELLFRFPATPPIPEGWVRDYVLAGNGWIKDGDYNSMFSKTVLPLPSRKERYYTTLPTRLEDDPVYKRYQQDWQNFHTRYVTPQQFGDVLRVK